MKYLFLLLAVTVSVFVLPFSASANEDPNQPVIEQIFSLTDLQNEILAETPDLDKIAQIVENLLVSDPNLLGQITTLTNGASPEVITTVNNVIAKLSSNLETSAIDGAGSGFSGSSFSINAPASFVSPN